MTNMHSKLGIILELVELGERAFIYKLKKRRPLISPLELEEAVRSWYRERPGAEQGDAVGVPGDVRRFDRCDNSKG